MELAIFVALIIMLTFFLRRSIQGSKRYKDLKEVLETQPDFDNDSWYLLADGCSAIGLDRARRKICIVDKTLRPHILTRANVRKVEILVDNRHYITGSFLKQWSKFLLVEKITGNSELAEMESHRVEELLDKNINVQLMVATNSLHTPNHYLSFLINGSVKQKKSIIKDVHDWASIVESL